MSADLPPPRRTPGNRLVLGGAVAVSMAGVLLIVLGVGGALGGGGDTAPAPAARPSSGPAEPLKELPGVPASKVAGPMRAARPTAVYIPSIGVAAPLMELGLDDRGAIQNPPFDPPNLAGWYRYGPVPGQRGAAVITGHLDTRTGPAVFARLKEVKRGAQVQVLRADRSVAVFVVDKVEHTPKGAFPAKKVYAKLRYPGLRLVTCGGAFDRQAHSYEDNTIVYAHLAAPYYPRR
ncbi:class F sortase [Nonomuraea rubra]|uniref:Sortase (Surface protein transpeptidase) n=1 Tax=Nonomuraea rubra TaxID=46180 RepID=A0A7X0NR29_9ACTN|nr:class F sortase [Nonomuraea rubra]MBB6548067.1 sortase (surface protein transpeptidase) [Nonomuraea rubra]